MHDPNSLRALGAIDARAPGPLKESSSQTAGPYVHIGCVPNVAGLDETYAHDLGSNMRREGAEGEPITLRGTVLDGLGEPVRDALIECWQADANGRFAGTDDADPSFDGFGRCASDAVTGEWRFDTVRPGRVPWSDGRSQAPHVTLWVVARGINLGLHTRVYFEGDAANADDPLLSRIEPARRRETMIARPDGPDAWRLDIRLQRGPTGEPETVFLDM